MCIYKGLITKWRNDMGLYVGVDAGSSYTKVVIMNSEKCILSSDIEPMGISYSEISTKVLNKALAKIEKTTKDMTFTISTGYGRKLVPFAGRSLTEIYCHAKAVHWLYPEANLVIDVGGQDSKVIMLDEKGRVADFLMNDKCAAGTGRFLEVMARALRINFEQMDEYSLLEGKIAPISSVCTVFAESEVISMLASGYSVDEIVRGIYESVSQRIKGMVGRCVSNNLSGMSIIMTGGAAKHKGLKLSLEKNLGSKLRISNTPQMMGALGASLAAVEEKNRDREVVLKNKAL